MAQSNTKPIDANLHAQTNFRPKILLSIVIPTLNEFENLTFLIPELLKVLNNSKDFNNNYELIIVDDLSEQRTEKLIKTYNKNGNIILLPSKKRRGLAKAALQGFRVANGIIVALMDGDGSHEPKQLPKILEPILRGKAYISVGSRYIEGGTTSEWSTQRKIISKVCALLAQPLSGLNDSGSGFFAFRKDQIKLDQIRPSSWKLGLEICAKFPLKIVEVPIHFEDRRYGQSKLRMNTCFSFIKHLTKLYYKTFIPNLIHRYKKA